MRENTQSYTGAEIKDEIAMMSEDPRHACERLDLPVKVVALAREDQGEIVEPDIADDAKFVAHYAPGQIHKSLNSDCQCLRKA